MEPGMVPARTRRTCVMLTVAGSLLLIVAAVIALVNRLLNAALPQFAVWVLVLTGLSCGASLIFASAPQPHLAAAGRPQLTARRRGAGQPPQDKPDQNQHQTAGQGTDQARAIHGEITAAGPPQAFGQAGPPER